MNSHDQLFEQWQRERPDYRPFSNDGILVEADWNNAPVKIAFLLKESNDSFYEIRGHAHGPRGNSPHFWRNLRIWRHALTSSDPKFNSAVEEKELPLSDIAYINLKKKAENRSKSDHADIQSYVDGDWDFIKTQIENIAPDVLFCCGTFNYIKNKMELNHQAGRIYKGTNRTVIDFYHPSCTKSREGMFNELLDDLNRKEAIKTE